MKTEKQISKEVLEEAFNTMCLAKSMTTYFEANFKKVSKYVHATSRGHEAIQIAVGMQLQPQDYAFPYYRDDAFLLSMGMQPYDLMLQLLAKKDDPFTGGRSYYSHPSLRLDDKPKIPHQSSATGMQAIPATGAALGLQYKELEGLDDGNQALVFCSLGDASITEGEVSEAFQMAALKQLPILYIVQDNEWDISAYADEVRAQNAYEFIQGFKGVKAYSIDGTDFEQSYHTVSEAIQYIRSARKPVLIHAKVPLLNHHTSGVRMEWYRDDLEASKSRDPFPLLQALLLEKGCTAAVLEAIETKSLEKVSADFDRAWNAANPSIEDLKTHIFAPTDVTEEEGNRTPAGKEPTVMVDCALLGIEELLQKHPECLLYGQDVGIRLGGVFREAATLAKKFGTNRVFNTPIQEAFIVGSTVGMSAVGLKPIVEVQFADYIWPGLNQLFTEVSRSCYLSNGKWPVSMVLRVPIGAYGNGGPYHSSSVESVVANIQGIKIAYPSNGADLKGLLKAAYYDPNPVVIFEHKGLYWSKIQGTEAAKTIEPDAEYRLPFGKAKVVQEIWKQDEIETLTIVTYGMGVYWALKASEGLKDKVEIVDLRTLFPLDTERIFASVRKTGKCIVLTEEPKSNGFARTVASKIQEACFKYLDAPVTVVGSEAVPAIPINSTLEAAMLPNPKKVLEKIKFLLNY